MSAVTAPIKADMEMTGTEAETATIARAAPALAPEETPTISYSPYQNRHHRSHQR